MKITWDNAKRLSNLDKHGLDFAALDMSFFAGAVVAPGKRGRWVAIGRLSSGAAVTVIFARLGSEALSIISMRRSSHKERKFLHAP
jgi:hypothetical protein